MRKQPTAVPAAHPAPSKTQAPAACSVLRLTARLWLTAALLRAKPSALAPDERVRLSGEW